jgi:reverse gyrase
MEKQEKKERKILTDNRMMTVNKRETSFEGLSDQLENGEDGIYNLIANDKNIIFQPKISITKKDVETIPFLRQLREEISIWDTMLKTSSGKEAYTIKKALIEMRKDQYVIKQAYQRLVIPTKITHSGPVPLVLEDTSYIDENF